MRLFLIYLTAISFMGAAIGSQPALAEAPPAAEQSEPAVFMEAQPSPPPDKSPLVAGLLSVGGAAVGWGTLSYGLVADCSHCDYLLRVATAGIMFGSSLGHVYNGDYLRGAVTGSIRGIGMATWFFSAWSESQEVHVQTWDGFRERVATAMSHPGR